jgi:hypothetical protein
LTPFDDDATELTYTGGNFITKLAGVVWVGRAYGAANRRADLFEEFVGLIVFFGIVWRVVPVICVRLAEV